MENIKDLQDIISTFKVLYAEDDRDTADAFIKFLGKLFGEVVYVENGQEGLDFYKQDRRFDLVITDIRMPVMDGLTMAEEIKKINKEQNILIVSGFSDSETILRSIKIGIDGYLIKPINAVDMNNTLHKVCTKIQKFKQNDHHQRSLEDMVELVTQKNKALNQYIDILNNIALISRTDRSGIITDVNDFFCEVSEFSREEMIGQKHDILRHQDMPKAVYDDMWQTIKAGNVWKGKIKNRTKNGNEYFVQATIIPLFGENNQINEYIGIRVLTTQEEQERREFKKKVMLNYQEFKKDNFNSQKKIQQQEKQLDVLNKDLYNQAYELKRLKEHNQKILAQKNFLEKENRYLKSLETSSESIKKMVNVYKQDQETLKEQEKKIAELKEKLYEKEDLEDRTIKQEKIIRELKQELEERPYITLTQKPEEKEN